MLMLSLSFLLVASVLADPTDVGVTNGTEANIKDHPWMVSTWAYSDLEGMICTAFLVALDWALTSGYCKRRGLKHIRAGSNNFHDTHVLVDITEVIRHPNYTMEEDGTLVNDLLLLHLSRKISGTSIFPINLPEPGAAIPEGETVKVVGWGNIGDGTTMTNFLHEAEIRVTSKKECQEAYSNYNLTVTDEEQFCVGTIGDTVGPCHGDGGGPVEWNGTAIGLISWQLQGCSSSKMPGVVTNLAHYVDWIRETIGN